MKKLYTLTVALVLGATSLFAQGEQYLQFLEKNAAGEFVEIKDGAVLTRTTVTSDDFQGDFISSNLYIKSVKDETCAGRIEFKIVSIDNGAHSICYGGKCTTQSNGGTFYSPSLSSQGNITTVENNTSTPVSMQTEWFFTKEGKMTVEYTLDALDKDGAEVTPRPGGGFTQVTKYAVKGKSQKITVNYVYDPTGIKGVENDDIVKTEYFDVTGKRISQPATGLYIKKMTNSNGKVVTRKVVL